MLQHYWHDMNVKFPGPAQDCWYTGTGWEGVLSLRRDQDRRDQDRTPGRRFGLNEATVRTSTTIASGSYWMKLSVQASARRTEPRACHCPDDLTGYL